MHWNTCAMFGGPPALAASSFCCSTAASIAMRRLLAFWTTGPVREANRSKEMIMQLLGVLYHFLTSRAL